MFLQPREHTSRDICSSKMDRLHHHGRAGSSVMGRQDSIINDKRNQNTLTPLEGIARHRSSLNRGSIRSSIRDSVVIDIKEVFNAMESYREFVSPIDTKRSTSKERSPNFMKREY